MTVVDVFSRKTWLAKLKQKEAANITEAFQSICTRAGVKPNQLICDNGLEFRGEFENWCSENNVTIRRTIPHNPQSNGICERMNLEVRKSLRALMLKFNTLDWTGYLTQVENMLNSSFSSTTKSTPNEIWMPNEILMGQAQSVGSEAAGRNFRGS